VETCGIEGEESMRNVIRGAALLVAALTVSARGQDTASADAVVAALRGGGHVIVFRHGATNADQADTDPLHLDNVAQQRQLNEKGRAQAKTVAAVFQAAAVKIGKCYSSRFNRAVETARAICGKEPESTDDVTEGGLVVSPNENNRRAAALRTLAGTVPAPGTNTLVVTHKPNITDAFGKDWFDVKEGEASVFKPDASGKYALVGRVQIDHWQAAKR
jgi:broad specificity phosphatase PhoE